MASPRERDHRGGGSTRPFDPRVTTYPSDVRPVDTRPFDPRVTTYPSDVRPVDTRPFDPRVTTYPSDVRPVDTRPFDPRVTTYPSDVRPVHRPARRHHFHDVPPWPQQHHHDYVYVDRGGWWPRWFPYWEPRWYAYWWYLYDYYGGDAYPEYAEYARDAVLRQNAPQWGLTVSGGYGRAQIGIDAYDVVPTQQYQRPDVAALRATAFDKARKIYVALGTPYVGLRSTPWGGEVVAFGHRRGLERWTNEQSQDTGVWYAVAFDLTIAQTPFAEVAR